MSKDNQGNMNMIRKCSCDLLDETPTYLQCDVTFLVSQIEQGH